MTSSPSAVGPSSAEHYTWGEISEGWRLLAEPGLSVIQERVPPGGAEAPHLHTSARQFFFVLAGEATLELPGASVPVRAGQGLHVPPGVPHRFVNRSASDVHFLVISAPSTAGDRVNLPGL